MSLTVNLSWLLGPPYVALYKVQTTDVLSSPSTGEVRYRYPTSGFRIRISKTNQFSGRWVWGQPHVAPFHYQALVHDVWGQSLGRWPRTGRDTTKCKLTYLKRTSKTSVYDIIGSSRKTRRGLCNLSKLNSISTIFWFVSPLTLKKKEESLMRSNFLTISLIS